MTWGKKQIDWFNAVVLGITGEKGPSMRRASVSFVIDRSKPKMPEFKITITVVPEYRELFTKERHADMIAAVTKSSGAIPTILIK